MQVSPRGFKQLTPRMRHSRLGRSPRLESERKSCAKHLTSWSLKLTTVLVSSRWKNGKAWRDAMGEALYAAEFFRWFSEEAVRVEGWFPLCTQRDKTIITDHKPMGVAYMITPWNFPAAMITRKLGPALAAGCTAVLKPPAETPLTALWIGEILERAGAPAGVVNIVTTSKSGEVSSAILADPRVATLSFTGSTFVGKCCSSKLLSAYCQVQWNSVEMPVLGS